VKSILVLAPWWLDDGHVGNRRMRRHLTWLSESGWSPVVVCAGSEFQLKETAMGLEITVPDPLRIHGPLSPGSQPVRKPHPLRRWVAYAVFNPDPSVVWTRAAMKHPIVRHHCRMADLITASSPPEAPFLGAMALAKRYDIPFWMDMRDGWLDEPLKPLLRRHAWQRWREKRLEEACLTAASLVTVTSETWKDMLRTRIPDIGPKVSVVTNASVSTAISGTDRRGGFAYAGRFHSSRPERSIRTLAPFLPELTVIGDLTADERDEIRELGWSLRPPVPVADLPKCLAAYGGLVLLSESMGSIPAKFFDYLAAGRPILAVCPRGSAMWNAGESVPQVFRVDPHMPDASILTSFREASRALATYPVPERYSPERVRNDLETALHGL
jgi:hypothetical protein